MSTTPRESANPGESASPAADGQAGSERLLDKLADFLARIAPDGTLNFVSSAGARRLGRPEAFFARGNSLFESFPEDQHARLRGLLLLAGKEGRQEMAAHMKHADGRLVPVSCRILPLAGHAAGSELLFAAWDVGHCVGEASGGAAVAQSDPLTGLANRIVLTRRLAEAVGAGRPFTAMHLDIDGFKKVNDAFGHALGDNLILETGERLKAALRNTDLIARMGGDEFAMILYGNADRDGIGAVANKVLSAMQRTFVLGNQNLHVSASIGVAIYPEHGNDEHLLLKHSDIALYQAKESGRNCWRMYTPESGEVASRQMHLEAQMFEAVQNGEFEMHYQPVFHADSRVLAGVEALMRWQRPGREFVSPAEFIPLAEANGLIDFLGHWSLRVACVQVARWNGAWGTQLKAAVNVSPRQFHQANFVATVADALKESGLDPACLALEITEGLLMRDPQGTEVLLNALRAMGPHISVDDFGTGYSSLAYLKRIPLSTLKVDRAFVRDLTTDANDRAIVELILSMARQLGLKVIVEGVETEAQLAFLNDKGCDFIQGFLLGRPVPARVFEDKVEAGEWRTRD